MDLAGGGPRAGEHQRRLCDLLGRYLAEVLDVAAAQLFEQLVAGLTDALPGQVGQDGGRFGTGAVQDGAVEQPACGRGAEQGAHRGRTGRLAEDGDVARVAAEGPNVAGYPLQRGDPVLDGEVAARAGVVEEAERAEPVVERHHGHAALDERTAVPVRHGRRPVEEAAAVDPDHDRLAGLRVQGGRPDVEVEAVLARGRAEVRAGVDGLDRGVAEVRRVAHAVPGGGWLGRGPAQWAHRRGGKRQASEAVGTVFVPATNDSLLDADLGHGRFSSAFDYDACGSFMESGSSSRSYSGDSVSGSTTGGRPIRNSSNGADAADSSSASPASAWMAVR